MFVFIVIIWLLLIVVIGIYNIIKWNLRVYYVFFSYYIYMFFKEIKKVGWIFVGGLFLCIIGKIVGWFLNLFICYGILYRIVDICRYGGYVCGFWLFFSYIN